MARDLRLGLSLGYWGGGPPPGAAETDPVLAEWFLRRFSLLDSLYMVPPPKIVGRAMAHNVRLWAAQRRQAHRRASRQRDSGRPEPR